MKTLKQRFNAKIVTGPKCWLWVGAISGNGYGNLKVGGVVKPAHRLSYEINLGQIPDGMHVMHKCDNPTCVNPAHLSLGTHLDNMRDMYSKGRRVAASGLGNGAGKLTEAQIQQAVADPRPSEVVGPLLGVSGCRVRQIRRAHARQLNS